MRLRTIGLISILALGLLAAPLPADAQQAGKVYRIGFLTRGSVEGFKLRLAAFRQGLRELEYLEGKNIVIEERYAEGRRKRLPALAEELVRFKVDVIVVHGGAAARAANEAGRTIPVVFAVQAEPVGTGLVASLARPGGNITGLSDFHSDLIPKRLELLQEVVPSASRIAALWDPTTTSHPRQWKLIQAAAPKLGVTLLSLEVPRPEDFDHAFATMRKERPGGLVVFGSSSINKHRKRIIEFLLKNRLPAIHTTPPWAVAGGLMSYGTNLLDLYRRSATYVDKLLKGAKPAELPVEQPTKFELVINLKTAIQLGITIPPSILYRADKVIK